MNKRETFLTVYKGQLQHTYSWALDPVRFERFMKSVMATIDGDTNSWNRAGPCYDTACTAIGVSNRISMKALREILKKD